MLWLGLITENMIFNPVKRQMRKAAEPRNVCRFGLLGGFFQVQRTPIIRIRFKYSGALPLLDDLLFGFYKLYRCAAPDPS